MSDPFRLPAVPRPAPLDYPSFIAREVRQLVGAMDSPSRDLLCRLTTQLSLSRAAQDVRSMQDLEMLGDSRFCEGVRAGLLAAARLLEHFADTAPKNDPVVRGPIVPPS